MYTDTACSFLLTDDGLLTYRDLLQRLASPALLFLMYKLNMKNFQASLPEPKISQLLWHFFISCCSVWVNPLATRVTEDSYAVDKILILLLLADMGHTYVLGLVGFYHFKVFCFLGSYQMWVYRTLSLIFETSLFPFKWFYLFL